MEAIEITSKDFLIIGKLHAKANPESAKQIISQYREEQSRALDQDIHNLNFYFLTFCQLKGFLATDYIGNVKKRDKTEARKLFIATMMRVFHPQLFTYDLNIKSGLAESLCIVLRLDSGEMSKIIDEVKPYYIHNWQDFNDQVNQAAERLVGIKNGYACSLFDKEEAA